MASTSFREFLSCWLQSQWARFTTWHALLLPLAALFGLAAALRRSLYRLGWLTVTRLSVPVLVVGNIAVGGTGKTPLVIALARRLREAGYHPGIVSRGYGGVVGLPRAVSPQSDPLQVGDEPVLLARASGCPVWVGRARVQTAQALLAQHPEVDLIISDDGLQHYALARDVEIVVVDAQRWFGNGQLLPAGPLREPTWRLQTVDAVVINGWLPGAPLKRHEFTMRLMGEVLYNLRNPALKARPEVFAGQTLVAMAGIGHPERFFEHLRNLGLAILPRPLPDHHRFTPADLEEAAGRPIVMTEKDAVKCAGFAGDEVWVLPVCAELDPRLLPHLLDKLRIHHGSETA
ncbi:tetraacyldisaccharide 4'-kinase [Thiobacter aerophilum]|uniref:Tetraacyldisaccharide 4'-kinase n=1 Tax=Thiobacter aerophilum TaxID=3121275 RepID=A0ABV0EF06_9BURK